VGLGAVLPSLTSGPHRGRRDLHGRRSLRDALGVSLGPGWQARPHPRGRRLPRARRQGGREALVRQRLMPPSRAPHSDEPPRTMRLRRTLTTLPLVFVLFFNVSGGPFTIESLVAQVGPGVGILILVAIPLVWSLPETLIVAELASMLPEEGGYYRWVHRA